MLDYTTERSQRLQDLFAGRLYMILAILVSVDVAAIFLEPLTGGGSSPGFILIAVYALMLVGVWTLYASARERNFKPYSFAMLKVRPIAMAILFIMLAVGSLLLFLFTNILVKDFAIPAIDYVIDGTLPSEIEGNSAAMEAITRITEEIDLDNLRTAFDMMALREFVVQYGKIILYAASGIGLVFGIVLSICGFKISGAITKIRNTVLFGYDEPIKTTFICSVLYIFAGLSLIASLTSLIINAGLGDLHRILNVPGPAFAVFNALKSALEIAILVLTSVFFGKVKQIME